QITLQSAYFGNYRLKDNCELLPEAFHSDTPDYNVPACQVHKYSGAFSTDQQKSVSNHHQVCFFSKIESPCLYHFLLTDQFYLEMPFIPPNKPTYITMNNHIQVNI